MDRCRLKNIIILILALLNGFLLFSLAQRRVSEQRAFRRTAEQMVALFAGDGMTLDPGAISRDDLALMPKGNKIAKLLRL